MSYTSSRPFFYARAEGVVHFLDVQFVHAPHHVRIFEGEVHVIGQVHAP